MFALPLTESIGSALFSWTTGKVFLGLHLSPELCALLLVCAGIALGNGFITPTLNGMVSKYTARRVQGRALGLMQSAGSLGRFLGPLVGFWLVRFDSTGTAEHYGWAAFWVSGAILLVAMALVSVVAPVKEEPVSTPVTV
jgi:MFS transporter, DHA1 family, tetracycline resistance protein